MRKYRYQRRGKEQPLRSSRWWTGSSRPSNHSRQACGVQTRCPDTEKRLSRTMSNLYTKVRGHPKMARGRQLCLLSWVVPRGMELENNLGFSLSVSVLFRNRNDMWLKRRKTHSINSGPKSNTIWSLSLFTGEKTPLNHTQMDPNQSQLFTDAHGHPHLSFPDGVAGVGELVLSLGGFLTRFPPQMEWYVLWCPHLRCFQTEKHLSSLQNDSCCWNINCQQSAGCCLTRKF